MGKTETYNETLFEMSPKLLSLRDSLVVKYRAAEKSAPIRNFSDRKAAANLQDNDARQAVTPMFRSKLNRFCDSWFAFERALLEEKEEHAVRALSPLVDCVLALDGLLKAEVTEQQLPEPRRTHHQSVLMRYLLGLCQAVERLIRVTLLKSNKNNRNYLPEGINPTLLVVAAAIQQHDNHLKTNTQASTQTSKR
eukprot:GHVT01030328.1.p1 GENE.GHVT01030328.1~~GHVT01030328.1.p1  ORF type:complete len:194 (+),score=21.68 GHVT01030328.1:1018-1599(+)